MTTSAADAFSYDEMRDAIEKNVPIEADRETLIAHVEHLRSVEGTEAFESAYAHFVQSAENHLSVLGPFLAKLSALFGA